MTQLGFSLLLLLFAVLLIGSILWRAPSRKERKLDREILGLFQEEEYLTLEEIDSRYRGSAPLGVLHKRIGSLLLEKRLKRFQETFVLITIESPRPTSTRQVYALSKE